MKAHVCVCVCAQRQRSDGFITFRTASPTDIIRHSQRQGPGWGHHQKSTCWGLITVRALMITSYSSPNKNRMKPMLKEEGGEMITENSFLFTFVFMFQVWVGLKLLSRGEKMLKKLWDMLALLDELEPEAFRFSCTISRVPVFSKRPLLKLSTFMPVKASLCCAGC